MNTLKHNNFIGTFNYIEEEEILHGKIEGITDLVTFQGESIPEIKQAFIEAIEDYISLCEEIGKEPLKSFKGSFNIRVPSQLHREASLEAIRRNINLNQFVQAAIEHEIHCKDHHSCC